MIGVCVGGGGGVIDTEVKGVGREKEKSKLVKRVYVVIFTVMLISRFVPEN